LLKAHPVGEIQRMDAGEPSITMNNQNGMRYHSQYYGFERGKSPILNGAFMKH
jgi:hypothetical protein